MNDLGIINTYLRKKLSNKEKIRISKLYSGLDIFDGESKKCLLCGENVNGFCKSHSLPKFVLKSCSSNGKIRTGKTFQNDSYYKDSGVGNALVFSGICDKCDNTYFQDYEHEHIFFNKFNDLSINEIAIKNLLRYLHKQKLEVAKYEKLLASNIKYPEEKQFYENQLFLCKQNAIDTNELLNKYKRKKTEHNFYVIDEIDLDYSTEIAYQGFVTLVYGFSGLINNIYDYESSTKMQQLGICVIPHSKGTKVLLYCEEGLSRLKLFYKKYRSLDLKEKLYVINYILLLYEEEWVVSASFNKKINKETLMLINQHDTVFQNANCPNELLVTKELVKEVEKIFELKTSGNIYNFLERK